MVDEVPSDGGVTIECVLSMLIVGFLWGATNPLLRIGSKNSYQRADDSATNAPRTIWRKVSTPFIDLTALFLNWRFSIPFIVNQTASVLFVVLVSRYPVSVVVPCVNALQFVFTAVVGHLVDGYATLRPLMGLVLLTAPSHGERIISRRCCFGVVIVLIGVLIMMVADTMKI